jgi:hypothetical protein
MSNTTDVAQTLSTTQILSWVALSICAVILIIGYFYVCFKVSRVCNTLISVCCALMLLVVIGCIIAIIAITDNPSNLTWVVNHV